MQSDSSEEVGKEKGSTKKLPQQQREAAHYCGDTNDLDEGDGSQSSSYANVAKGAVAGVFVSVATLWVISKALVAMEMTGGDPIFVAVVIAATMTFSFLWGQLFVREARKKNKRP